MTEHPAVVFLLAAHRQAEETARAAASAGGGEEWTDGGKYGEDVHVRDSNSYVAIGPWGCGLGDGIRMHIALHDPAAVLRRVAAEREILAMHQRVACGEFGCDCHQCCSVCRWTEHDEAGCEPVWGDVTRHVYPCRTVLLLAKGWGWEEAP